MGTFQATFALRELAFGFVVVSWCCINKLVVNSEV